MIEAGADCLAAPRPKSRPRGAPRFLQKHEREKPQDFRQRQQFLQEPSQADGFPGEIRARQRFAGRHRVALVVEEIKHLEHGLEPGRQFGGRRNLVRYARVANLRFGAHDALGDGGGRGKKRPGDGFGGQAADLAQRKGRTGFGGQGGMAAGEDETQAVVLDGRCLLAFLILGPMIDLKNTVLLSRYREPRRPQPLLPHDLLLHILARPGGQAREDRPSPNEPLDRGRGRSS